MRRLSCFLALLCLGAAMTGCGAKKPPPPAAPRVVVALPLQEQISDWDDYVGRFVSVSALDVRPRVTGYVQSAAFRDGQLVRRGQLLFVIDPRPYQALLDQAKAQAARAAATLLYDQVELKRAQALLAARATSQQDVDTKQAAEKQGEADLAAAKAAVATAALNVAFTRVTSPIDGRVSDNRTTTGNLVSQDSTVMTTVVSLDPIRFDFNGPESLFLKGQRQGMPAGAPVQIRLQDETDYRWNGRMAFVDNAIDPGSGAIHAYALVRNPNLFLTPGLFGHMRLLGSRPYPGLLVPDQALVTDMSRQLVYVVGPGGEVAQRVVQPGPLVDGLRVIRSGLEAGDRVVISGVQRARPGQKVQAVQGRITARSQGGAQPAALPPDAGASATFASR